MITDQKNISIQPFRVPCNATTFVPGSKSISNRALILSVMCNAKVELEGLLESEDVDLMREALETLGIQIEKTGSNYIVHGTKGEIPKKNASLNVGNAGTIARFLTCLLAAQKEGNFYLDGSEAMRKRPMLELLNSLYDLGCKIEYSERQGHFPYRLITNGLKNKNIIIDAQKSSQNISGILMQCGRKSSECIIKFKNGTVSVPFVEMTLRMMRSFCKDEDLKYLLEEELITITNCCYKNTDFLYKIEPDATAASYFLTLPLVLRGRCTVLGINNTMIQGDIAYCDVLNQLGADISFLADRVTVSFTRELKGGSFNFVDISDTFLSLAAISPLLGDRLEIYGIEHTRKQETDRISAMVKELRKLGQDVTEKTDRIIIHPDLNKLRFAVRNGIHIDTYKDHRFAMSFAILGCFDLCGNGEPWLKINDPGCCTKTFPDFFNRLNTVHLDSHAQK
ncbi:MAG: 3-phosphoshikimate 1-carboxyvinyltransferase [Opitutae bacterium]